MPRIALTRDLILAAARDRATQQMRKAKRQYWNEEDWDTAVAEYERLLPYLIEFDEAAEAALRG